MADTPKFDERYYVRKEGSNDVGPVDGSLSRASAENLGRRAREAARDHANAQPKENPTRGLTLAERTLGGPAPGKSA